MSITLPHTRSHTRRGAGPRRLPTRTRAAAAPRRVRHEVRDGMAVVAFSAVASSAVALGLAMLLAWTR